MKTQKCKNTRHVPRAGCCPALPTSRAQLAVTADLSPAGSDGGDSTAPHPGVFNHVAPVLPHPGEDLPLQLWPALFLKASPFF